jgi:hypothetical protein
MTKMRELIASVGEERFFQAREWAWATAAGAARSREAELEARWSNDVLDVSHDLSDPIWDEGDEPWIERVALASEL